MSIRIRIYPQPGSIGLRRKRAARIQQQRLQAQQFALLRQQELLRQQQLQMSMGVGFGTGYGSSFGAGYGTGYGSFNSWSSPFGVGFGTYANGLDMACPPPAAPYASPFQVSPYGSSNSVWYGSTGLYDAGFGAYGC